MGEQSDGRVIGVRLCGNHRCRGQTTADYADDSVPDKPCIEWNVKSDRPVNKRQAERLYGEACRWVEANVAFNPGQRRPCVIVNVGEPCPDTRIQGSCANPVTGELFIPKWEATSAGTVAQGTISTMLLHLFNGKEITKVVEGLMAESRRHFSTACRGAQRNNHPFPGIKDAIAQEMGANRRVGKAGQRTGADNGPISQTNLGIHRRLVSGSAARIEKPRT